jgi:hypothetical protein
VRNHPLFCALLALYFRTVLVPTGVNLIGRTETLVNKGILIFLLNQLTWRNDQRNLELRCQGILFGSCQPTFTVGP